MKATDLPSDETGRLQALLAYNILDTPAEKDFDDIVKLASEICQTPISLLSLVDYDRQWFKAKTGLENEELPRETSFCAHAILQDTPFLITDALTDERFRDNPLVQCEPYMRSYAAIPLINPDGYRLGTLCVIDRVPRQITEQQVFSLQLLARQVIQQLEIRLKNQQLAVAAQTLQTQNQQLSDLNQQLEGANQLHSRFLSIISHDVRTPINLLRGFLPLLNDEDISPSEQQKIIDKLAVVLASTDELLTNLVHWTSRQIKGRFIAFSIIDLSELVENELGKLAIPATHKYNLLINSVPSLTVWADRDMLRFILRNLLSNANKYTSGGTIEVHCQDAGDQLLIAVKDSGQGMTRQQQEKLFNWHEKNSQPGTNGEHGSGVGLLLCRDFIEDLQGKLWIESEPDKGTTFFFTLSKYEHHQPQSFPSECRNENALAT